MGDLPKGTAAARLMPEAYSTESNPSQIRAENWAAADKATREIIRKVQPTSVSEEKRRKVVDYIQRLIRNRLGAEVFPYGSVPLKTYLPDGDIDLTAFGGANVEETLVDDIRLALEEEEKNTVPEFVVKDVQIIRAEVKLVKCIVQDIVIDVSFNQIGGLCTLCFLEQVDRLIGKDHLFKRSIILIKAWCYYESRILGAHHGLISTYALEILVLYIFHLFHSTLDGPLAVLYKFLDYFSKFDWNTYCVSLHGPVRLSSMPDSVAEMPEDSNRDLLLSNDFLSYCAGMFSVPSTSDKTLCSFQRKHLNIVDPLKEINNLGRSVSKGNFYRIRSAFSYGARKLAKILLQPKTSIANELHKFFPNTMARHGGEQRPDVQEFEQSIFCKKPISEVHIPEAVLPKSDNSYEVDGRINPTGGFQSTSGKLSQDLTQEKEGMPSDIGTEEQHSCSVFKHQTLLRDPIFHGDSNKLDVSSLGSPKISPNSSIHQTPVQKDTVRAVDEPFSAQSKTHDDGVRDVSQGSGKRDKCEMDTSSSFSCGFQGRRAIGIGSLDEKQLVDREAVASRKENPVLSVPKLSSTSGYSDHRDMELNSARGSETPESLSSSDLTGDYDGYLRCLQYGRWWHEYGLGLHSLHVPPLPATMYHNSSMWDGLLPVSPFKQNGFSPRHLNGFHPNPPAYPVRPVLLPGVAFGWEKAPKPKGTGTYIPNTNHSPRGFRSLAMKGKNQAPSRSLVDNGQYATFEPNIVDRCNHEPSEPQFPVEKSLAVSSSDNYLPFSPHGSAFPNTANGSCIQSESVIEFEIVGHGAQASVLGNASGAQASILGNTRQAPVSPLSRTQIPQPALSREQDRISLRSSYHLRDEDDFPPLSVRNEVERLSVS